MAPKPEFFGKVRQAYDSYPDGYLVKRPMTVFTAMGEVQAEIGDVLYWERDRNGLPMGLYCLKREKLT